MPKPHSGETREAFVQRCMVDPEAKRTRPDNNARLGFCEGVYDEHVKKEKEGKSLSTSSTSIASPNADELQVALLDSVRTRKSPGLYGIRTARPYLRSLDTCLSGAGMCPKSLFGKSTDEWQLMLKEADSHLTYSAPDLSIKELDIRTSGLLTPKAIMEFPHVITTTRKDRDGDILESGGAVVEAKALLAFHNQSQPLGPFLEVTHHDKDAIHGRSAILDTSYGRDMAVLVEGKALSISHGFKAVDAEPIEMVKSADGKQFPNGWHVKRFHIYEVSLVSVPANADAVITSYSKGLLHDPLVKAWAGAKFEARPKMVPVSIEFRENGQVVGVKHYTYREESDGRVALVKHKPNGGEEVVAHASSMEEARKLGHQREEFEHMGGKSAGGNASVSVDSAANASGPLAKQVAEVQQKRALSNPPPNEVNGHTPMGSGSSSTPSPGIDSKRCPNCNTPVSMTGETFVRQGVDQDVVQCQICGYVFAPGNGHPDGAAENERNANGRGNSNPIQTGEGPKQPTIGSGNPGGATGGDPNARAVAFQQPGEKPPSSASGPRQPMLNGQVSINPNSIETKGGKSLSKGMAHRVMAAHGHAKAAHEHMHEFLKGAGHSPNDDGDFDDYGNPADPNNPSKALAGMGEAGNMSGSGGQASLAAGSLEAKAAKMTPARVDKLKMAHLRSKAAADHLHSVLLDAGHEPGLGDDGKKESGAGGSGHAESDAAEDARYYGQSSGDSNMHGRDPYRHGKSFASLAELTPAAIIGQLVSRAYDGATTKEQLNSIIKALEDAGETAAILKRQQESAELSEMLLGVSG